MANEEEKELGFLVFAITNKQNEIVEGLSGYNVIPDQQYDYFFYLEEEIDILQYLVIDNKLVPK